MVWMQFLVGILVALLIITFFLFLRKLGEKNIQTYQPQTLQPIQTQPSQPIQTIQTQPSQPIQTQPSQPIQTIQTQPSQPIQTIQTQPSQPIQPQTIQIPETQPHVAGVRRRVQPEPVPENLEVVGRSQRKRYYEGLENHEDSSQNAHDKQINIYLKRKYTRLLEVLADDKLPDVDLELDLEQLRIDQSFAEVQQKAEEYINSKNYLTEEEKLTELKKIEVILKKISEGYTITSISETLKPVKENLVFSQIWRRIHHDDNKKNMRELEISFIDSLLDGVEPKSQLANALGDLFMIMVGQAAPQTEFERNYSVVCINGRVSRMLASLTILDSDEKLSKPVMDLSEVRNEAYMKAGKIADDIFNESDAEFKKFYFKTDLTTEQEFQIQEYEKKAKNKIKEELTKDYEHLISKTELEETIKNAQAGVNSDI